MAELEFQMLTHRISVAFLAPEIGEALRYLLVRAVHAMPVTRTLRYVVQTEPAGFTLMLDGTKIAAGLDAEAVMRRIYSSVYEALLAAYPSHLRVHAGCVGLGGRRVLVVGRKGAGKTTLMLRLLRDGHEAQGDEMVLVRADGTSIPLPRRFHVRGSAFALLPGMEAAQAAAPRLIQEDGQTVFAVAPDEIGYPWPISAAPADILVFLKPNHDGDSSLRPLDPERAARRLARQTTLPEYAPTWVERLSNLVHCSRTYLLYNGNLDHSAALLRDAFGVR